jgi:hypothetical protein
VSFGTAPTRSIRIGADNTTDAFICRALPPLLKELWAERRRALQARKALERDTAPMSPAVERQVRDLLVNGATAWHSHQQQALFVAAVERTLRNRPKHEARVVRRWLAWAKRELRRSDPRERVTVSVLTALAP